MRALSKFGNFIEIEGAVYIKYKFRG